MLRRRFDYDLLDEDDPFEIDKVNERHLYKHLPTDDSGRLIRVGVSDIYDGFRDGDASYFKPRKDNGADWLMIATIPGLIICVPLAPPHSGDYRKCRPIGLYKASAADRKRYLQR